VGSKQAQLLKDLTHLRGREDLKTRGQNSSFSRMRGTVRVGGKGSAPFLHGQIYEGGDGTNQKSWLYFRFAPTRRTSRRWGQRKGETKWGKRGANRSFKKGI